MNTTIVLAQVLGIFMTVIGLSLLISRKNAMAFLDVMTTNPAFMWLSGFMALGFGAVVVSLNNVWSGSLLQVFITVVGWLSLLKGIFILVFPTTAGGFYKGANKGGLLASVGVVALILGVVLLYAGF